MTDTSSNTPAHPSDSPATLQHENASQTATAPRAKRTRTRSLLIGGGALLAGLVLVGGGVAVGAAIADDQDDEDDRDNSAIVEQNSQGGTNATAAEVGTSSAADLIRIVASASDVADGDAVAIEAERDGAWDVTLVTEAGDETEVRVPTSGAPTIVSTEVADADDTRPVEALDDATIESLVAAALADTDGRILQLEIDDDGRGTYDVVVVNTDGRTIDIDLGADMTVTSSRIDD